MNMEEGMSGFHVKSSRNGGCGGGVVAAGGGGAKCGRWNPTSEQVKVLTELFRSGLRTPSTDQIQKISSQLSFYGKIESKNVFYWFQNHKARERQKRRRVFVDTIDHHYHHQNDVRVLSDDHRVSCTKNFGEMKESSDQERVIETLQLFPLNKYEYSEPEKARSFGNECKENESPFTTYSFGTTDQLMDHHHHPPLDLRLSFV